MDFYSKFFIFFKRIICLFIKDFYLFDRQLEGKHKGWGRGRSELDVGLDPGALGS